MAKKTIEKPLSRTSAQDPQARRAKGVTSSLLLSAKSLARELDVSERTIRKLNNAGKIPKPRRVGGNVRWSNEEIQDWIRAGCPALP